jgi:hypothetical protein
VTFGLNRIYLMFDKLGFDTTYHVVINKHVVEQSVDYFRALSSPLFTTAPNRPAIGDGARHYFLTQRSGPWFSTDLTQGVWEGATVTYVAMQIAFYLGFEKVILVGVDHNFVDKGEPHKLVESGGSDRNHFDPNYFGKGYRWQLPDLETSEIAYEQARRAYVRVGRSIVDATVDGKLTVFPKTTLEVELT